MRRRAIPVLAVLFAALFLAGVAYAWEPPVTSPVVDNWRPPADRYSAGNRGVDFAPAVNTPVKTSGPGVVSFAGQVGGTLYVTVDHDGGIKTTYGDLSVIEVKAGQQLNRGDVVGKSRDRLHFGVRQNGEYIDPNSLFGKPRLVPID